MRKCFYELGSVGHAETGILVLPSDEIDILPNGDAVDAPGAAQRPTRQRLAWIPLALSVVEHCAGRHSLAEALDQGQAARSLDWSESVDMPLRALGLVEADERRLSSHGQAHILCFQVRVDTMRHLFDLQPSFLGERLGRQGFVIQPANGNGIAELNAARLDCTLDRRGPGGARRTDERDVTFTR